jgi:phosphosulfolactate synthase (CoM biosynthesis protein A)
MLDIFSGGLRARAGRGSRADAHGRPKLVLIKSLRNALDLAKVLIELPGPWISGITLSAIENMKKFLVRAFGPDVNIATVMPHDVMETEALRVGLGVVGPTRLHHAENMT